MNKPLSHFVVFALLLLLGACTPRGNFDFSLNPSTRDAKQGETFALQVTVQRLDGFNRPLTVSLVPPSGVKLSALDKTIAPTETTATLEVFVDPSVAATEGLKATVRVVGDNRQKTKTLTLRVLEANFEAVLEPGRSVQQGQIAFLNVGLRRLGSFDQPVKVSLVPAPGLLVSASEATIGAGQTSATLMVALSPNAPLGDQVIKVKYVGGNREKIVDYGLKVLESDF